MLCGWIWSSTQKEERSLRVYHRRKLTRISGYWRKLRKEEVHDVNTSPNIISQQNEILKIFEDLLGKNKAKRPYIPSLKVIEPGSIVLLSNYYCCFCCCCCRWGPAVPLHLMSLQSSVHSYTHIIWQFASSFHRDPSAWRQATNAALTAHNRRFQFSSEMGFMR